VADTTGGAKTITATGATSSLTASTTFTVNPWAAFYNTQTGATSFSFVGTAPTSLLVEVHGLPAGTIAASSITIGGVATNHASVVIGASGSWAGAGNLLVVSPSTNVPYGPVNAVIDGITFNYAAGNIATGASPNTGTGNWGGVLISSIIGTATSTGVAAADASSYKPGAQTTPSTTSAAPAQNQIGVFGYGFVPGGGAGGGALAIATPTGAAFCTTAACTASGSPTFMTGNAGGAAHADANGAFFAVTYLGDTPWSALATPTTAASYTPTVTQAATSPANILSPSFGITPWIDTTKSGISSTTVDYTTSITAKVHGFGPTDVVTLTVGATLTPMVTGGTTGPNANGFGTTASGQVPDVTGGKQNLVATGSVTGAVVTATGALTYDPNVNSVTGGTALNQVAGTGGSTTILRTGTAVSGPAYGVHGLTANTAYSIVWNAISGPTTIGTFTSTATGGIPVPGVQVTIPADISGIHIIDIQATATLGTSAIFSATTATPSDFADSDSGLGGTYNTQFGDMLFLEGATLVATPTVANVGGSTVISGNGLAASTLYDLGISQAGLGTANSPSTCSLSGAHAALAPTTIVGSFTSTSSGAVPAAQSVAMTDMASYPGGEQGTLYCIFAQTGPNFGTATAVGVAEFELQANLNLNMSSAPIGHNVIASAHGLASNAAYNIVFNYQVTALGLGYTGQVVGAILSNSVGAGSATLTVPNVASGSYTIELANIATGSISIASAPVLSVTTSGGNCSNQGTTCMSVTGTPGVQTLGAYKGIVATYTDNSNAAQTGVVYAVVHNASGQTVYYTTATISPAGNGGTQVADLILFGLPSGSYTATLFVTSTGGTAISGTTTVSVTL